FENGPDLAIETLKEVKKQVPNTTLQIIGGGKQNLERLKLLTQKLGLEKDVLFHGFVLDNNDMAAMVRKCYLALAPYRALPQSVRWYADATKIRQYLASGLPVVTTQVPPLGKVVADKGAALVAKDNIQAYAKAIVKLLQDKNLYIKFEKKARELSAENTWEHEYEKAFKTMSEYEK
ncbi:MAG TPA: glycosyltransferase family 4 protein, partial [Patescibacteria group bacterium]